VVTLADIYRADENLFISHDDMNSLFESLPVQTFLNIDFPVFHPVIHAIGGKIIENVPDGYVILGRCKYCGRDDAGIGEYCGYKHCASCGGPIR
jgi:hypothetical protein